MIAAALLGLTACGGSGSSSSTRTSAASAERTRLETQLRSSLEAPGSELAGARDLDECVVQQANGLPLASLRTLVTAPTDRPVADPLLARCVAQGKGLSWIRGAIAGAAAGALSPSTPPSFTHCMVAGVDQLTAAQLSAALQSAATGDQSASLRLGQGVALACVQKPGIFEIYRGFVVSGIRNSLQRRHLPPAYERCLLKKAGETSPRQLATIIEGSPGVSKAFGEKLAQGCRAALGA